jgi:protein-arginine kinase activator protein McsA
MNIVMTCKICGRSPTKLYKHHLVPKVKGGKKGEIIECCKTCSKQVHMLFSESELAGMNFEELLSTEEMKVYLKWTENRTGDFKVRKSRRLRRK